MAVRIPNALRLRLDGPPAGVDLGWFRPVARSATATRTAWVAAFCLSAIASKGSPS